MDNFLRGIKMQFLIILIVVICFHGLNPGSLLIALLIHLGLNLLVSFID